MVQSKAATVEDYLAELPPDRRHVVATVRDAVNRALPDGYAEAMSYGMIGWIIPLARYPDTYNGQPLSYVALAAQKNAYSLYLTGVHGDARRERFLAEAYAKAGKKLDMGKSCLRFKSLEGIVLEPVATLIAQIGVDDYIRDYERSRGIA